MARRFRGLGVSPGVAVGAVLAMDSDQIPVVPEPSPPERIAEEVGRFHAALDEAKAELRALKDRVLEILGDHYAAILGAQLLILDDPALVSETTQRIRVGRVSARWAVKEVIGGYVQKIDTMDDEYLRGRGGDLTDVHLRLQRKLRGVSRELSVPAGPLIVVAHSLGPSDAVELARRGVVGLASDVGGRTSHTAILAQALSVPAVAGLHDMCREARTGDAIIVDGDRGEVILQPSAEETTQAAARREAWIAREEREAAESRERPLTTSDGVPITVRANIEFADDVANAIRFGAKGIGLYRSEFLFLARSPDLPSEEEHYQTYVGIARGVAPQDAVIRTFDLGGEKYFHQVLNRNENNPVLGLRGVRLCLERPDIFRPQLRGLLRAATELNLRVMLPLVTTIDEVREVRRLMREEAAALRAEGYAVRDDVPLGIMIEVPAAAAAANSLAQEVEFFSLGTNDLIQYALAVDRGNESVSYLYQPSHPGVLRLIRDVIEAAALAAIPVGVCGEMAADPDGIELLIGLGIRELSVQPRAVTGVCRVIRRLSAAAARRSAEQAIRGERVTPRAESDRASRESDGIVSESVVHLDRRSDDEADDS